MNSNLRLREDINLDEFKKHLINARENKGLSIDQAAKNLNISMNIIEKLENGDFEEIPNDIFIMGHIRTYLNWINIDPKLLVTEIKTKKVNLTQKNQNIIIPYKFKIPRLYIFIISIILFFIILIII